MRESLSLRFLIINKRLCDRFFCLKFDLEFTSQVFNFPIYKIRRNVNRVLIIVSLRVPLDANSFQFLGSNAVRA